MLCLEDVFTTRNLNDLPKKLMDSPGYFDRRLIYREQVKQLYKHMPIGVAGTLINSLVLTFVLWEVTPHLALTTWLTANILVSIFRSIIYLGFKRSSQELSGSKRQEKWFNLTAAVSGVVWGSAGILLFPSDLAHQSFLAFVLGGMVAGAVGTYSVILRTFLMYSLPALIPITIKFLSIGDHIHLAMGGMTLLFGILMFWTARRVNTAISSSLRLGFENTDLVRQLESRVKDRTADLEKARKELLVLNENLEYRVRDRTAELERRNLELQEFAFIASHDLTEPLRKIQTFGSLLKERSAECIGEQEMDYVSRMTGAANRMQELLDALLQYSRVESQGRDLVPMKLGEIVQAVTADLEVPIKKIGAHVEIGLLPTIMGDPYQWRQVFQNLIGNAAKYHRPEVKPFIKIYGEEDDRECHILVEDNGIGFDEKYLDKIFQPFQRLHGKDEYSGTGIGLAICKKIVERHGGTITARSTPNRGSKFIITLPKEPLNHLLKP